MTSERVPAVLFNGVSKSFGDIHAVRDLDIEINEGTVYGLLGPNGSGKSTTMRMMLGLITSDSGNVSILGLDPRADSLKVKQQIGYVPESPRLYEYLTGMEYLNFIGDVHDLDPEHKKDRIHEFLSAFELEGREDEMINGYSHGMKQKIAFIGAVLHRPRLLILDEPLSGLDPRTARITKEMIHRMAEEKVTTVFSTHVLDIADAMCDSISVLYEGVKVAEGTPTELRGLVNMPGSTLEEVFLKLTEVEDVQQIVDALTK